MWNFMISSRDLVTKYVSWQVHNGESVNFLFNSWNGYPPLAQNNQLQQVIPIFIIKWGHKIVNYVSGATLYLGRVIWKDINCIEIEDEPKKLLQLALTQRIVYLTNKEDKLIWAPSANGNYRVQNGYSTLQHMINQQQTHRAFFFCWNNVIMSKVGCFSWLALKKRIITSDKLSKLQIAQWFKCVLCDQEFENLDHLFIQCSFVH